MKGANVQLNADTEFKYENFFKIFNSLSLIFEMILLKDASQFISFMIFELKKFVIRLINTICKYGSLNTLIPFSTSSIVFILLS